MQVFNSRQLRSDALIGDFKLDIGSIYEEEDHNIANKWLLLSNADDANAGAKGYLLVSMGVLGSGDEAPVSSFKHLSYSVYQLLESVEGRPLQYNIWQRRCVNKTLYKLSKFLDISLYYSRSRWDIHIFVF